MKEGCECIVANPTSDDLLRVDLNQGFNGCSAVNGIIYGMQLTGALVLSVAPFIISNERKSMITVQNRNAIVLNSK